jgi:hypothetical protein
VRIRYHTLHLFAWKLKKVQNIIIHIISLPLEAHVFTKYQHCSQSKEQFDMPDKMVCWYVLYSNVLITPTSCQGNIDYPECDDTPNIINISVNCNNLAYISIQILLHENDLSTIALAALNFSIFHYNATFQLV